MIIASKDLRGRLGVLKCSLVRRTATTSQTQQDAAPATRASAEPEAGGSRGDLAGGEGVGAVARHRRVARSALPASGTRDLFKSPQHVREEAGLARSWCSLSPCDRLHIQLQCLAIVGHQHKHGRGSQSAPFAALAPRPRSDAAKAARRTLLPMLLVVACVRGTAEGQHRAGCSTHSSCD